MKDFQRLLKYLRPHLSTFVLATIAMVLAALAETSIGALIVPISDLAFNSGATQHSSTLFNLQEYIPQNDWFSAWAIISALLLTFTVGGGIAEYFSSYLMAKIGQSAVLQMRRELYEHLLAQSANFFPKTSHEFSCFKTW